MSLFLWFLVFLQLQQFANFDRLDLFATNGRSDFDDDEPPEHFDYEIDLNSILIGLLIGFGTFLLFCSIVSRVFSKQVTNRPLTQPDQSTMRPPTFFNSNDQRRAQKRPCSYHEPPQQRHQPPVHRHQHQQQHPPRFDFRQQHQRTFSAPVSTTTSSTTSSSFGSTNSSYIQNILRNLNAMIATATGTTKTNASTSGDPTTETAASTPPPVFHEHVKETKIDYCCQFDVNEKHVCTSEARRREPAIETRTQNAPSKPAAMTTSAKTIADIAAAAAAAAAVSSSAASSYFQQQQQQPQLQRKEPHQSIVYDSDRKEAILVEIALQYVSRLKELSIQIVQAVNVPCKDRGAVPQTQKPASMSPKFRQLPQSQIKVTLWSAKKIEYKTKIREGASPQFLETFCVTKIEPQQVLLLSLQLRLYRYDDGTLLRKRTLLAQTVLPLRMLHFEIDNNLWLTLDYTAAVLTTSSTKWPSFVKKPPVSLTASESCLSPSSSSSTISQRSRSSSDHSTQSLRQLPSSSSTTTASTHRSNQRGQVPELLLGLAFNATTGALAIEIVKGSNFRRTLHDKSPDSYVKLTLLNSIGHEMGYGKTTVARHQSHPLYKQQFRFQVTLYQLTDVTLLLAVYNRRGRPVKPSRLQSTQSLHQQRFTTDTGSEYANASNGRREMIGWLSFGLNSSGPEQFAHWMDMKDAASSSNHKQIARWHVLLLSPIVFAAETALAAAAITNCSDSDNA